MVLAIEELIKLLMTKRFIKVGIKFKLIAFTASLILIVILCLSFLVLGGIKNNQTKQVEDILFNQKDMFEQYFSERVNSSSNNQDDIGLARGSIFNKPWLRTIPANIYDTNGNILSGFKMGLDLDENSEKSQMIQYAIDGNVSYKTVNNVVYFYSPIKYKDDIVAILELKYSNDENIKFYSSVERMFYYIGSLVFGLGIILGIFYFSKFTKDIYIMKNSVDSIQRGNFNDVQKLNRRDELGELSIGINSMSETIKNNINELKSETDTLSKAVDKLRKMDKQQKEFIGNVTHEFKTPITTIKAYADLMGIYDDDPTLKNEGILNISKECERLADMIDRILNLSALEKYDFEIEKENVNLKNILEPICERMMGRVKKNNLILQYDIEDVSIFADKDSIRHIAINLIDNAIKYNKPSGEISVKCYKNSDTVILKISDTGIGIDDKLLSKIFEPFYRVQSHRSRETGGAGLGLALVKKLVEKQDGNIKVSSKINEGTMVTIEFSFQSLQFCDITL